MQFAPKQTRKTGGGTEAQRKALGLTPVAPVTEEARRAMLGLPPAASVSPAPIPPPPKKPSHASRRR